MTTETTTPIHPRSQRAEALVRALTQDRQTKTGEVFPAILRLPGPRADLKRCLGLDLDAPQYDRAWSHLAPYLPENGDSDEERAFAAVAAMVCAQRPTAREQDLQPRPSDRLRPRNLGASLAHSVAGRGESVKNAASHRLILIGRQNLAGVHRLVPRTALHLREQGVAVDWVQLIGDLAAWRRYHRPIARRWIQDFHRTLHRIEITNRSTGPDTESETK